MARIETSMSKADDAAASTARNYNQSAGCSMEQIFSPINIPRTRDAGSPTPGFMPIAPSFEELGRFSGYINPTSNELDPYFPKIFGDDGGTFFENCDYIQVVSEPSDDMNLRKNSYRKRVTSVRTQGLRTPLILSGWGFDVNNKPVPPFGADTLANQNKFNPALIDDRAYWKTGPLDVRWDDYRQVWTTRHEIAYGWLSDDLTAFGVQEGLITEFPYGTYSTRDLMARYTSSTSFVVKVADFQYAANDQTSDSVPNWTYTGQKITVQNLGHLTYPFVIHPFNVPIICIKLGYQWVPLWFPLGGAVICNGEFDDRWDKDHSKSVVVKQISGLYHDFRFTPENYGSILVDNTLGTINTSNNKNLSCIFHLIPGGNATLISAEC